MAKNFARTGKDVYKGIVTLLEDWFEENKEYTHEELVEKIKIFNNNNNYLYVYKDWKKAYDFLKFICKIEIVDFDDNIFILTDKGEKLKKIIRFSIEEFKDELFYLTYIASLTKATRFRDFCDFLVYELQNGNIVSFEKIELAKSTILKADQWTNKDAIPFLLDLNVISKEINGYEINIKRIARIDMELIALNLLRNNLTNNIIQYDKALELLIRNNIDIRILKKLENKEKITIRSIRTGRYLDFS